MAAVIFKKASCRICVHEHSYSSACICTDYVDCNLEATLEELSAWRLLSPLYEVLGMKMKYQAQKQSVSVLAGTGSAWIIASW